MTEIALVTENDLVEIMMIEGACFSPPWTEAQLKSELRSDDAFFAAARCGGRIAGFCIMHMAGDQGELYQIAVHPDFRRRGIGELLLRRGVSWVEEKNGESAFLEVRAGNEPALRLYSRAGFERIGVRKKYYTGPVEDAVIMVRKVM